MKYNLEVEIDDKAIEESGLDVDTYIRQEMGRVQDSGIHLLHATNQEQAAEQKPLYVLTETMEDEDAIRDFRIIGISENRDLLQHELQQLVQNDEYGFFQRNGFEEQEENSATSVYEYGGGFVSYDISEVPYFAEQDLEQSLSQGRAPFITEYLSGVEWQIAYQGENNPVAAFVAEKGSDHHLMDIVFDDSSDAYQLTYGDDGHSQLFETFYDAVEHADDYIHQAMYLDDGDKWPVHDLTGHEGIYLLGETEGKEIVANAFWSEDSPGYVNFAVFEKGPDGLFEEIDGGLYNGYLTIESCIQDLADTYVSQEDQNIQLQAACNWQVESLEEYQNALEDGALDGGTISLSDLTHSNKHFEQDAIDKPLEDLMNEAKAKAAEKSTTREQKQLGHKPPEPGL
ncbi:MAG: hypothetical protein ACI4B9_03695 [Eggerthellaceae bacterium]